MISENRLDFLFRNRVKAQVIHSGGDVVCQPHESITPFAIRESRRPPEGQ